MILTSARSAVPDSEDISKYTDKLTGLGNRARLVSRIDKLLAERVLDPAPFTVGIANLDGFKPINDLFGYDVGDRILAQIAHRLKTLLPAGASCARMRADEFGLLLPMINDEESATEFGKLIGDVLSAPYDLGERSVRLSSSFGFAIYPFAGDDSETIVQSADTALYKSKSRGRNQITVYSEDIADQIKEGAKIEQALRRAITSNDINVHFQPIIDLQTEIPMGFEALARWTDIELGTVRPDIFIPLAEERGFIDTLTDLLLRKAVKISQTWPEGMFLSFNLSSAQLVDPSTASSIIKILDRARVDARSVEMEITETAMISDLDSAGRIISELRGSKIGISLDDFGTGQSSLGRLRDFAFDKIKIDRSFVSKICDDEPTAHIVQAILAMCKGLDLVAVAEGIETKEQAQMLKEMGCSYGQGYLYGKPCDGEETFDYLKSLGLLPKNHIYAPAH